MEKIPANLLPLHVCEEIPFNGTVEQHIAVASYSDAQKIIRSIERRVTGREKNNDLVELPANTGSGNGQFGFRPHVLRIDMRTDTVTCVGIYSNDDSHWIIEVRFLSKRPRNKPVRFEIKSCFNHGNTTLIPFFW